MLLLAAIVGAVVLGESGEGLLMLARSRSCFSAVLFVIGVAGVLIRRNAIMVFMCVELMLNAVNLSFVAFAQAVRRQPARFRVLRDDRGRRGGGGRPGDHHRIFRHTQSVDLQNINLLKG